MQQLEKVEAMKAYHNTPGISSHILRKLIYGPREFQAALNEIRKPGALYFEENESLIIGNGVDMKMTVGEYAFNNCFYHPRLQVKPSPMVMSIMNQLYDEHFEALTLDEVSDEDICDVMSVQGYRAGQNWGVPAKLKNLKEEGADYFRSLAECKGRQILSSEELALIGQMADNLKASPRIQKWINPTGGASVEPQVIINFEHNGHACRSMLDFEWVNHELKIARPLDVKTTKEEVLNFPTAIRKFRYDLQGAFYVLALKAKYPDYAILSPVFLVESSTDPGYPMDFELDADVVNAVTVARNPMMVTLRELFIRLDWYTANGWEKHFLEGDGPIQIHMGHIYAPGLAITLQSSPCGVSHMEYAPGI
jgi:PDDEXK-like domain of unknown function (DUF3799)